MCELFACDCCNGIDILGLVPAPINGQLLCSECHPLSLKWHKEFPKEIYDPKGNTIVCNRPSGTSC